MLSEDLIANIDRRRKAHGITIKALSKEADIAPSTLVRWKAGALPSMRLLEQVSTALDRLVTQRLAEQEEAAA